MNPDAEAAFTPESGGFDLVAMAEGRQPADMGVAQAVADAEPAITGPADLAAVGGESEAQVAAGSDGNEAPVLDQLDVRRQKAAGACGEGACASCVQRCGSYNPYESDEEFNLVEEVSDSTEQDRDNFDFKSRIQFKGEEARERMAQRKAAKAKEETGSQARAEESQAKTSEGPTSEQRDQIIEIRKTAADPEIVKANLERGHARMAERQKEREERQARMEVDSEVTVKAVETVKARTETSQSAAEEPPVSDEIRPAGQTETATKTSRVSEVLARQKADQIVRSQAAFIQDSKELVTRHDQVAAENAAAAQADFAIQSITREQHDAYDNGMIRREETTASGSVRTPSVIRKHQAVESAQITFQTGSTTSSSGKVFRVNNINRAVPRPQVEAKSETTASGRAETIAADGLISKEVLSVQADTTSEAGDTKQLRDNPVTETAKSRPDVAPPSDDFATDHEFSLPAPAAEQPRDDDEEVEYDTPTHSAPNHKVKVDTDMSLASEEQEGAESTPPKTRQQPKIRKVVISNTTEETASVTSAGMTDHPRVITRPKKEVVTKTLSELDQHANIEDSGETDQIETDEALTVQTIDHSAARILDSHRKYSGGGEVEDIWKTNPDNRGRKIVARTSRRVRSSSASTHKAKRSKKKLLQLFAVLGRFVTENFNQQLQAEGAEA